MRMSDAKAFIENQRIQLIAGGCLSAACGGFFGHYMFSWADGILIFLEEWFVALFMLVVGACIMYVVSAFAGFFSNAESNTGYSIHTLMSEEEIILWSVVYFFAAALSAAFGYAGALLFL